MQRLIILIPILLSIITLAGCKKTERIGSIPSYLLGDWVAIDFPYDEFPNTLNNYLTEDPTRIKIKSDRYYNGREWTPIDLTRLSVTGGNKFTLYKKNSRFNDGWEVNFLDNPNRKFERYKGSIHIYEFTGKGDERYEAWYEFGYFEKKR